MRRSDFFFMPFVMDFAISMTLLLVNLRAQDLGATAFQLGLLGFAWGLTFASSSAASGRLSARFEGRSILTTGSILYGLSAACNAMAARTDQLIAAALLGGLGSGLFWPCFETFLHDDNPKVTRDRMGLFNVGWTLGLMSGSTACGYLYDRAGPRLAFGFVAALVFVNAAGIAWRVPRHRAPLHASSDETAPVKSAAAAEAAEPHAPGTEASRARSVPVARRAGYLTISWVANFTLFFGGSVASTIFPKLARSIGIPDGPIGMLLAVVMVAQGAAFALLSRTARWHYRIAPLIGVQAVSAAGLVILGAGGAAGTFAAGFAMMGLARGLSYTASLYYGLDADAARGVNTGFHEAIIGAAFIVAPLVSGVVAERFSLRTPFVLAAGLILAGVAVEIAMWGRLRPAEAALPA